MPAKRHDSNRIGDGERAMKDRPHDQAMAEMFRDDPSLAAQYLTEILRDGDLADLRAALRQGVAPSAKPDRD